jgi:hypothetical protein
MQSLYSDHSLVEHAAVDVCKAANMYWGEIDAFNPPVNIQFYRDVTRGFRKINE